MREFFKSRHDLKIVEVPKFFNFRDKDDTDFEKALSILDWEINDRFVLIDFSKCEIASYQTLSLIVLYVWHLKIRGCHIDFYFGEENKRNTVKDMWNRMGATGWSQVLFHKDEQFNSMQFKPLIAIRGEKDFQVAMQKVQEYTESFNIEYNKTLSYIVSELLYNALEHGYSIVRYKGQEFRIPAIIQFTWYRERDELHIIIADLGIGIKEHLKQSYPDIENDVSALLKAIAPKVSGTFNIQDPYKAKNNAGFGLFYSSNIARELRADMYIVSGSGILHISPRDNTRREMKTNWPGTFVFVRVSLSKAKRFTLEKIMQSLREQAFEEISNRQDEKKDEEFYVNAYNYFGKVAENKEEAKRYRDRHLIPAIQSGKNIKIDFNGVVMSPHSFLNALLATPIRILGMQAYKKIKVINADNVIRETIDHIMDENSE